MNKQEAVRYVEMRLAQDVPHESIVESLAAEMRVPRDPIEKFVTQIESDFRSRRPEPPPPPPQEAAPAVQLPPWLQDVEVTDAAPAMPALPSWMNKFDPQAGAHLSANASPSWAAALPEEAAPSNFGAPAPKFDDPELARFVMGQLTGGRKRSDIVMKVCERTGADWASAQRFVAQVAAENHAKINARKNILIIPVGLLFVVAGLGLGVYGGLFLASLVSGQTDTGLSAYNTGRQIQGAVGALLFGVALTAGGVIGIIVALRSQAE